jgi:hypothetical protein
MGGSGPGSAGISLRLIHFLNQPLLYRIENAEFLVLFPAAAKVELRLKTHGVAGFPYEGGCRCRMK